MLKQEFYFSVLIYEPKVRVMSKRTIISTVLRAEKSRKLSQIRGYTSSDGGDQEEGFKIE